MAATSDPVVILSAARTPLGRFMGELSPLTAHKLGSHVIGAALERAKLQPEKWKSCWVPDGLAFCCMKLLGTDSKPISIARKRRLLPD